MMSYHGHVRQVERGVEDQRDPAQQQKGADDRVEEREASFVDCLQPSRAVDVRHRRNLCREIGAHLRDAFDRG